ncbi:hypothetical protein MKZ38_009391 [Zalerion maritima]|uniref:Methyltransferase domain-containing protein n=1 Tax=Zalerion maritima TaxID=339359 RepID=A0AAD5S1N3_9PEZI|nr:hypothetical protein MKZ38_009391 [Zalerion maritima]
MLLRDEESASAPGIGSGGRSGSESPSAIPDPQHFSAELLGVDRSTQEGTPASPPSIVSPTAIELDTRSAFAEAGGHLLLASGSGAISSTSVTSNPLWPRMTVEQREFKRRMDQARRDTKTAVRIRRSNDPYTTSASREITAATNEGLPCSSMDISGFNPGMATAADTHSDLEDVDDDSTMTLMPSTEMEKVENGRLYSTHYNPVDNCQRVLDVGTGTGSWAIDFADEHQAAEVIGVDISPIQPDLVPPNCQFQIDDMELLWNWEGRFDFVFCRFPAGSFKSIRELMVQAHEHLEPGGCIEIQDLCLEVECDDEHCPVRAWSKMLAEAGIQRGRPLNSAPKHNDLLEEAGFKDIKRREYKWPLNQHGKDRYSNILAFYVCRFLYLGAESFSMRLLTEKGMTKGEVESLCLDVEKALWHGTCRGHLKVYEVPLLFCLECLLIKNRFVDRARKT